MKFLPCTSRFIFTSLLFLISLLSPILAFSQGQSEDRKINIWELMERRDLRLSEIDALAKRYFDAVGKVRGTGYKQYERWKYEKQFHLDEKGYILPDGYDAQQYQAALSTMETAPAVTGSWTELGPTYWSRTTSWNPGVGRVTSIAVAPSNNNIIYITSPGGGIWKSMQGGNQWTPLAEYDNTLMDMYAVAVHPTNPDIVLAGKTNGQVAKSTDGGTTWVNKSGGVGKVLKLMFNPSDPQIVFAVGASGISKSIDGGNTFVSKSTTRTEDIEFQPGNTGVMIASGYVIQRSDNFGETWATLGSANGITNSDRTLVSVSAANPQVVYAVQASGSLFGRLYRSDDGGNTFITTVVGSSANGTNYFGYETSGTGTSGQASYDMGMTVNPLDANEVHIAGIICWKSTNGGYTFVPTTAWSLSNTVGYNHADVHVLEWVGATIYSGSDGGIYKSTNNAGDWTDLTTGLGIRQFYRIANAKTNTTLVTGGAQDNGSSILKATGWIDWLGADGMDCLVSPLDANLIWGTSQYGSLYRTSNGGSSYSGVSVPASGNWVTPLAIQSNANVIYGGWNGVYRSTDLGSSWTKLSGTTITSNLSVLAVAPSDPNYIYASTGTVLYVTKDGGTTWSTYPLSGISITSFAIHPANPEKIWISSSNTTNRVLVSTNAGASFTNMSGNLPAITARSIVVDDTPDEGLYVAMNIGVYYINKNLSSWVNLTDNLPTVAINEVELQKAAGKVRIGTYGRGIWETSMYNQCGPVSNLSASNIGFTDASLSWAAVSGAQSYAVEYKARTASSWTVISANTTSTSVALSNLTEGTTYDWRVSVTCASNSGAYVQAEFTTKMTCADPTLLSTTNLSGTSATLNWNAVTGSTGYDVDIKLSTASTWTNKISGTTATSLNISGLLSGSSYEWRVRSNCGTLNGYSAYSTAAFDTPCADIYEANNTRSTAKTIALATEISAIIDNAADEDWFTFKIAKAVKATNVKISLYNLPANFNLYLYDVNGLLLKSSAASGTANETLIYNTSASNVSYYILVKGDGTTYATSCYKLKAETSSLAYTDPNQCDAATGLSAANVGLNSATLNWTGTAGALSYEVDYKLKTATLWTNLASQTSLSSLNLSGLQEATAYDWRVGVNCTSSSSTYALSSFTTGSSICPDNYEANNSLSAAKTISTGTAITATIGTTTDVDWFRISMGNTKATNLQINLTALPQNFDLELYDLNGLLLASSTNSGTASESITWNSKSTRTTYYVKVIGVAGTYATSCYTLTPLSSATAFSVPAEQIVQASPQENTTDTETISIYPNPAKTVLNVVLNYVEDQAAQLQLMDANGNIVYAQNETLRKGKNQFTLDLSNQRSGIYYLKLMAGGPLFIRKVIIEK